MPQPMYPDLPPIDNHYSGSSISAWVDQTPQTAHSNQLPQAGEDCAMIYDPVAHRIIIFGGKTDQDKNVNEIWQLDLESYQWQQIDVNGQNPPPSEDHVVVYDPIGYRLILHGGEDGLTRNFAWAFDLKTKQWKDITDESSPAQEDHTAIFDSRRKRIVTFGGFNSQMYNIWQMYALYLDSASPAYQKWLTVKHRGNHPPGRIDHVAVYDSLKDRMVIFGGWDMERRDYFGDTWEFSFALGRWREIKTLHSHPAKRRHSVGVYDNMRNWLIIYGGYGEKGFLNDIWAFDLSSSTWINITPGPQPRIDHQAIFNPKTGNVLIYGGDALMPKKFHDLWELRVRKDIPFDLILEAAQKK
ncbi:MAG: kelch repeat-containing protein [bacterium]